MGNGVRQVGKDSEVEIFPGSNYAAITLQDSPSSDKLSPFVPDAAEGDRTTRQY